MKARKKPDKSKRKPKGRTKISLWTYPFVFAFVALIYSNTVNHQFVLDDPIVTTGNKYVQQGISGIGDIVSSSWYEGFTNQKDRYYRPTMLVSYAIEVSLFGNSAKVHHLFNLFYYGMGCLGLFLVFIQFTSKRDFWFPLFATLLFAAHPLHTEVVANIKGRDELLSLIGLVFTLWAILKYVDRKQIKYFILSIFAFCFALLSKESAIALLAIIPFTLFFFTNQSWKSISKNTIPFVILTILYVLLRHLITDHEPTTFTVVDNSLLAINSNFGRLTTTIGMVSKYAQLLFFPYPLSYDYSYAQIPYMGLFHPRVLAGLLIIGGIMYLVIKGIRAKSILAYSLLFIAFTFAPVSNLIFPVGTTFAERFMFIPSIAFCLGLTFLSSTYLAKYNRWLLIILLGLYSTLTIIRNPDWKSDFTLFSKDIKTAPKSFRTQSYYGKSLYDLALSQNTSQKNSILDSAAFYLERSLRTFPDFYVSHINLGLVYDAQEQSEKAITAYQEAIRIDSSNYLGWTNLGISFYRTNQLNTAIPALEKSVILAPDVFISHRVLGLAYQKTGNVSEAEERLKNAFSLNPNKEILQDLVNFYRAQGDIPTAQYYDQLIKNQPIR